MKHESEVTQIWFDSNKQFIPFIKAWILEYEDEQVFYDTFLSEEWNILDNLEHRGLIKVSEYDIHCKDGSVGEPWYILTPYAYKLVALSLL